MSEEGASRDSATAAERPAPAPLLVTLAWLVPGLGHFLLGRRARAAVFLGLVLAAIGLACSLDGGLDRFVAGDPISKLRTVGAMGMGLPYFMLRFWIGYEGNLVAPGFEYGKTFMLTAGLMNLLLMLDVWDIASGRKE